MVKRAAAHTLWLAKGAALFWGSALTLALVIGVATTTSALVSAEGCGDGRFEVRTRRLINSNGLLTDTADDTVGFVIAVQ